MKEYQTLKGKKIFREVLRRGRRYYEGDIQLIIYQLTGYEDFLKKGDYSPASKILKVGIHIQRKFGNAVKRNHIKRQLRVICRELLRGAENNFFIIIRPLENFKKMSYFDTRNIVEQIFEKAGVLRPK